MMDYLAEFIKNNKISKQFYQDNYRIFKNCEDSYRLCKDCQGLSFCRQKKAGERISLYYDGLIVNEISYCPFFLKDREAKQLRSAFIYCDIPEQLCELSLENINVEENSSKGLYIELADILEGKRQKGLYIHGQMGVGKTYLCIALANSLNMKKKSVSFIKVNDFVNNMRKLIINDSLAYERLIRKIKEGDYLFIDDIGAEGISAYSRDDLLFNILDYRLEHHLLTVFTSNLDRASLEKIYALKGESGSLMHAKRLLERIRILSDDYVLSGENKRI